MSGIKRSKCIGGEKTELKIVLILVREKKKKKLKSGFLGDLYTLLKPLFCACLRCIHRVFSQICAKIFWCAHSRKLLLCAQKVCCIFFCNTNKELCFELKYTTPDNIPNSSCLCNPHIGRVCCIALHTQKCLLLQLIYLILQYLVS